MELDLQSTIDELYQGSGDGEQVGDEVRVKVGKFVAANICSGKLSLVQVIESLGSKLTSKDVGDRVLGIDFLSKILSSLPKSVLSETELSFIVDFLVDRLKDQHLVIPKVIFCIEAIVRYKNLPKNSISRLLTQLFTEANIQSHIHKTRRAFFTMLQYVLENHIEELKSNNQQVDFVPNFLQSMDGEKDPRNLLILFNLIPRIIGNFSIDLYVEDFFEILSCYFPVDFNPNPLLTPGSEQMITRKVLLDSLHNCLSSTNQWAELLIPLAMEKLDSSLLDAKLDTLGLLKLCCDRCYSAKNLEAHISSLWHGLRREIFMGGNEVVEKAGFELIKSAFFVLSGDEMLLEKSIQMIFTECKHHLSEPELKLSQPASKILLSIAHSTPAACSLTISTVLPLLYEQFLTKRSGPERRGILPIISELLCSVHLFPSLNISVILSKWDEILALWFSLLGASESEFIYLGLRFFGNFLQTKSNPTMNIENLDLDLNRKSRDLLQCHLKSLLEKIEYPNPMLESAILDVLVNLAKVFPAEIQDILIPYLFTLLCRNQEEKVEQPFYYKCLEKISMSGYGTLANIIFEKLTDAALKPSANRRILLSTISSVVANAKTNKINETDHDTQVDEQEEEVFLNLISSRLNDFIKLAFQLRSALGHENRDQEYKIACQIIQDFMQRIRSPLKQQEILNFYLDGNEKADEILDGLLGESLLGSLYPSVSFNKKDSLLQNLLTKIIEKTHQHQEIEVSLSPDEQANIRLYAGLLNKSENDEKLDQHLAQLRPALREDFRSSVILLTVTKALAMRGYRNLEFWVDKTIGLLCSPNIGKLVAQSFAILVADDEFCLSGEKSHCVYRFLYKQRLFQLSVPKLVQAFRTTTNSEIKGNYVYALSIQLKHVSQVVLEMELKNVLPLLVASLHFAPIPKPECEDESVNENEIIKFHNAPKAPVLSSTLFALKELLETTTQITSGDGSLVGGSINSTLVFEYLDDIIPRLVKLTGFQGFMDVRILALKCLQICARIKSPSIVNLQNQVVTELQCCLDDPKRLVRKEAAFTRNIWILINSPGGL